jgi:hypothetical protein
MQSLQLGLQRPLLRRRFLILWLAEKVASPNNVASVPLFVVRDPLWMSRVSSDQKDLV